MQNSIINQEHLQKLQNEIYFKVSIEDFDSLMKNKVNLDAFQEEQKKNSINDNTIRNFQYKINNATQQYEDFNDKL